MASIAAYCRPGFEADLAREIETQCSVHHLFGFSRFQTGEGFVAFDLYEPETLSNAANALRFEQLVFARQLLFCPYHFASLPKRDRIGALDLQTLQLPRCGAVRVEYPDTQDGKSLSTFCRKFTVPLRQALRKHQLLTKQENQGLPVLHLFFYSGESAYLGYTMPGNASAHLMGIMRLKFPSDAPSRSTLKLDEAIQTLLTESQRETWFKAGNSAVDLGACPGGWTYQLVRRSMRVEAIDNGAMDVGLMETGLVEHYAEDGFRYRPRQGKVDVLVCDMIERPDRVATLMAQWVANDWCKVAIFNLKLPMKKRFDAVVQAKSSISQIFQQANSSFALKIKHLYHDRDEVTAVLYSAS